MRSLFKPLLALGLLWALAVGAARAGIQSAEIVSPGRINHGAGVVRLEGGGLLACWYSGASEAGRDVRILCSSTDERGAWRSSWVAVDAGPPNKSLGNVVLFRRANGKLWMVHGVIRGTGPACAGWRCGRVDIRSSDDEGRTWSAATNLLDARGALPRSPPVTASGLGLLLPAYVESPPQALAVLVDLPPRSEPTATFVWPLEGARLIQPAFALDGSGGVRAFLRDPAHRFVYAARFDIAARAWSRAAPTNLPNAGSAVAVFEDRQDRFVLIYNPSTRDRRTLALARSQDGRRFTRGCDLVAEGADGDVAYPSVVGDADTGWDVVWSAQDKHLIRWTHFDEPWLDACFAARP